MGLEDDITNSYDGENTAASGEDVGAGGNPYATLYNNIVAKRGQGGNNYSNISQADLLNRTPEEQEQTGDLGVRAYFPDFDQPVAVGQTASGKFVPGTSLFAPGTLVPYGAMDARQKVLQDAAVKRAKQDEGFLSQSIKTKHLPFQEELANAHHEYVTKSWNDAVKKVGPKNARAYLQQNPDFQQKMQNFNVAAQKHDLIMDNIHQAEVDSKTAGKIIPPEAKKAMDDVKYTYSRFGELDTEEKNLAALTPKIKAVKNVDTAIKEVVPTIKPMITELVGPAHEKDVYDLIKTGKTTKYLDSALQTIAEGIHFGEGYDSYEKYGSISDIKKRLVAQLSNQYEEDVKTVSTREGKSNSYTRSGGGLASQNWKFTPEIKEKNILSAKGEVVGGTVTAPTPVLNIQNLKSEGENKPVSIGTTEYTDAETGKVNKNVGGQIDMSINNIHYRNKKWVVEGQASIKTEDKDGKSVYDKKTIFVPLAQAKGKIISTTGISEEELDSELKSLVPNSSIPQLKGSSKKTEEPAKQDNAGQDEKVIVTSPNGQKGKIKKSQLDAALKQGYKLSE